MTTLLNGITFRKLRRVTGYMVEWWGLRIGTVHPTDEGWLAYYFDYDGERHFVPNVNNGTFSTRAAAANAVVNADHVLDTSYEKEMS